MRKVLVLIFAAISLIAASCNYSQLRSGDDEMNDNELQLLFSRFVNGELSDEMFNALNKEVQEQLMIKFINSPLTEEQLESFRLEREYRRKTDLAFLVRGSYTPASDDVDFHKFERFIFYVNINAGGYGLVIDRRFSMVYYDPYHFTVWWLRSNRYSAQLHESDVSRFVKNMDDSGLRYWESHYSGEQVTATGSKAWALGILFGDGTILRRSGSGECENSFPPGDQFSLLNDFVRELGAEVIERHKAEAEKAGK